MENNENFLTEWVSFSPELMGMYYDEINIRDHVHPLHYEGDTGHVEKGLKEEHMNYPDKIYNSFEIVVKDIYGERHYGLVKLYKFLGITFKKHVKVWGDGGNGVIWSSLGKRWHTSTMVLESAIKHDNDAQEKRFKERMTK